MALLQAARSKRCVVLKGAEGIFRRGLNEVARDHIEHGQIAGSDFSPPRTVARPAHVVFLVVLGLVVFGVVCVEAFRVPVRGMVTFLSGRSFVLGARSAGAKVEG